MIARYEEEKEEEVNNEKEDSKFDGTVHDLRMPNELFTIGELMRQWSSG